MRAAGVHHLALKSRDPEALAHFYVRVLGLTEERRHHDQKGLRSIWLDVGGTLLMLERAETEGPRPEYDLDPPGIHLMALRISIHERDAWRGHLHEHRVPILRETAYTLYIADPEGNRVGLSFWPEAL